MRMGSEKEKGKVALRQKKQRAYGLMPIDRGGSEADIANVIVVSLRALFVLFVDRSTVLYFNCCFSSAGRYVV